MISRDELIAALEAQGLNVGVQVSIDCVPLEITGIDLDEQSGRINLRLNEETVLGVLRAFLSRASETVEGTRELGRRRNALGHFRALDHTRDGGQRDAAA